MTWRRRRAGDLDAALGIGALGNAFFQTTRQSLLFKRALPSERGMIMGIYLSSGSLARDAGQARSGTRYGPLGVNGPC